MNGDDLQRVLRRFRRQGIFVSPDIKLCRCNIHGEDVVFSIANMRDGIQRIHARGSFYEPEELALISRYFPAGGRLLDVGANIGNHTLYAAKFLHASWILPVEPNPAAIDLLVSNIFLNHIENVVDFSGIGYGAAASAQSGLGVVGTERNLGNGKLVEESGDLKVVPVDSLVEDSPVDMIKIDVEGMEMLALAGLSETIEKNRPNIFIEVDETNYDEFSNWLKTNNYLSEETFSRYKINTNHMIVSTR